MKKVLALVVVAACALPVFAGAQQADNAKMLQAFSAQGRPDWGNLQVILLNDRTVEALFANVAGEGGLSHEGAHDDRVLRPGYSEQGVRTQARSDGDAKG